MRKNFKQVWKEATMPMPSLPLYGLGELVCYDGLRWAVTAFEPNEAEGVWMYDLEAVDGSDKTKNGVWELGLIKSYLQKSERVEKPGNSIHSPKWDSCVDQVEGSSKGVNAYAVCTAMLGDASFKSMDDATFEEKMAIYMQKLGISDAGPVPNSLLARQDLEGTTRKGYSLAKSQDLDSFGVWYYDKNGAQLCAVFNNIIDAEAFAHLVEVVGYADVKIVKGAIEQTGKQLDRAVKRAEDAGEEETKSLVGRIKNIQLRRQKATLSARGAEKSFSQHWKENKKA